MTNREFVLKAVRQMPATASYQEILRKLDELLLAESIRRSLRHVGKGVPAAAVLKLVEGWVRDVKRKKRTRK
jgi:hypothetical protein